MTVLTIKRAIAVVIAFALASGVVVAVAIAGRTVLAAQSGADRSAIFTDAALSIEVEEPTTWQDEPGANSLLTDRMRDELAGLWHDAMVVRNFGGIELNDASRSRFSRELVEAFPRSTRSPISSIVHHELRAVFVSDDGHLVELVGATTVGVDPRPNGPKRQESFTATMVLRSSGWTMVNLTTAGLTNS